jgi:orotidine-5'-phosphate decarboxylase
VSGTVGSRPSAEGRLHTADALFRAILERRSYLCVGLDTDPERVPEHLLGEPDPVLAFNRAIIAATADLCVAYKPNTAFYEALGPAGWETLRGTRAAIPRTHLAIADAKRGDIGNTARRYARAFYEALDFDALTVAPYMGRDSVEPFLEHEGRWAVLLALTSNPGSADFQRMAEHGEALHERVLRLSAGWAGAERLMYVLGATHPEDFARLRALAPEAFFLVPGVGAQGGDLDALSRAGMNPRCGLLVNSSRGILYAGDGPDFADAAREAARDLQRRMDALLTELLPQAR